MLAQQQTVPDFPVSDGQAELIVETDGSFLPVMTPDESNPDQRKGKHRVLIRRPRIG